MATLPNELASIVSALSDRSPEAAARTMAGPANTVGAGCQLFVSHGADAGAARRTALSRIDYEARRVGIAGSISALGYRVVARICRDPAVRMERLR
jgi:hypothetical protein